MFPPQKKHQKDLYSNLVALPWKVAYFLKQYCIASTKFAYGRQ